MEIFSFLSLTFLPFIGFFLHFPVAKKLMTSHNRWCQHFIYSWNMKVGGGEEVKLKKLPSKIPDLLELSFDVSLLIEIQYLQLDQLKMEDIPMKERCFETLICRHSSDEYRISSNKRHQRLSIFATVRCSVY